MPALLAISNYQDSLNAVRPEGRWFVGLARDHGYRVTLMTNTENASYLDELTAAGVRIIDWHPSSKFSNADRDRIREELHSGDYDLLHLFNNKAITPGLRAAAGWPGKVLTYRGYTGNVNWWDPTAYLKHLHPRVDAVICVSDAVRESFRGLPTFNYAKAITVGKGHDPAWYADVLPANLETEFDIPPDRTVVAIVANARTMKGMDYLGAAIRMLPADLGLHFIFIGRGLKTPEFETYLTDSYYAHQYTFAGFRTDVLQLLAAADVSVLASVKGEGLSKVLLESMFLGVATIMTNIGGNKGLAVDGETALIVPAKDEEALATALEKLAEDEELRNRLGPAGRAYVSEHYHARRTAADLDRAYRSVLEK